MQIFLRNFVLKFVSFLPNKFYFFSFKVLSIVSKYPITLNVLNDQILIKDTRSEFEIFNSRPRRIPRYRKGIKSHCEYLLASYCLDELNIPDNSIIVDVGANVGELSYLLNKKSNNAQIIAIEPDPQDFRDLVDNIDRSFHTLLNTAVANYIGYIDLYMNNDFGNTSFFPTRRAKFKMLSTCTTLDEIYINKIKGGSVFLIKLEAEGLEPEVLQGALLTLSNTKYLCCDTGPERMGKKTFREVDDFLHQRDFLLVRSLNNRHLYMNSSTNQ
jgi:FkbM family methyltransferase